MELPGGGPPKPVLPSVSTTPTQERRLQHLTNYDVLKTIGEGTFAKVAIKIIDRKHLQKDEYALKHWQREAAIMKLLVHPNIIQLYEVLDSPRETFLVMEYADGGELKQLIKARGKLVEKDVVIIFRQEHCHGLNIVHRDLKAENILLTKNLMVKLTDFNLSNHFSRSSYLVTCCGSPAYAAPELIEGKKYVGPEVDVWSLGVNMFYSLAGHLPFVGKTISDLQRQIIQCSFEMPTYFSDQAIEVLTTVLLKQPMKRNSLAKLKAMQLFIMYNKSASDLLANTPALIEISHRNDIDDSILEEMKILGFETEVVIDSLMKNLYDGSSATYKLLLSNKKQPKPAPLPTNTFKMYEAVSLSSSPVPSPRSLRPRSRTVSGIPDIAKKAPLYDLLSHSHDTSETPSKPEVGVLKAVVLPHITTKTIPASASGNTTHPLSQNNMMLHVSSNSSSSNSHSDPGNLKVSGPLQTRALQSDTPTHAILNANTGAYLSPEMQPLSPIRTRRHSFM